ncbi:hypothetical protein CDL15_Pgr005483 [Punica granatum]|uniref:DUF4005 domain-containing protein n=1 Tax=Punica granatum TaxID=22663 RepID=A0A218WVH9_PUNGR|nr:hypothetical protein CDL15_Pgr005483 [Punica granatum]
MGRATRWLRGFLGMKKDRDNDNVVVDGLCPAASGDKRVKKRWSFSKPSKETTGHSPFPDVPANVPARRSGAGDGPWLGPCAVDAEKEKERQQSSHVNAMAVAAATAAAADAAAAAAEAAVVVVRLTAGPGRGALFGGGKEFFAAVTIQSVFRGFLARKALRALRALVKLQAVVRGYLVRKRAAMALQRMQSLIRAQTTERRDESRSEFHSKRFPDSLDIPVDDCTKVVEIDSVIKPRSRSRRISSSPLLESRERIPYSSPIPCPVSRGVSTPDCGQPSDLEWCMVGNDYECRFNRTCHSTPGFPTPAGTQAPSMPMIKSMRGGGDGLFHLYSSVPSYMANTKSFRAKLRSQSAPKQRPEDGSKKRLSLSEIMASRNSISSVRMERSFSHLEEIFE